MLLQAKIAADNFNIKVNVVSQKKCFFNLILLEESKNIKTYKTFRLRNIILVHVFETALKCSSMN